MLLMTSLLTSLTDTLLLKTMHNSSRRDKGQLKAKKLKNSLYTTHGKSNYTFINDQSIDCFFQLQP